LKVRDNSTKWTFGRTISFCVSRNSRDFGIRICSKLTFRISLVIFKISTFKLRNLAVRNGGLQSTPSCNNALIWANNRGLCYSIIFFLLFYRYLRLQLRRESIHADLLLRTMFHPSCWLWPIAAFLSHFHMVAHYNIIPSSTGHRITYYCCVFVLTGFP
jgi:hypothetical protein